MDTLKKVIKQLKKDKTIRIVIPVFLVLIVALVVFGIFSKLSGVKIEAPGQDPEKVTNDGIVTGEATEGVTRDSLVEGNYYILHDNLFYPVLSSLQVNFDPAAKLSGSSSDRVMMTASDNGHHIPTLYIGNEDKLVYYSEYYSISYATMERYTDEGVSIGIYSLNPDEYNGYYWFSIDPDNDIKPICASSSAYALMSGTEKEGERSTDKNNNNGDDKNELTYLTITDIGDVKIGKDCLSSTGIIKNLKEGETYDTAIYNGTNYNDYPLTADTRFFTGMEAYAIPDVPLLQDKCQEISTEDLPDGYYFVNGYGMIRLVSGESYVQDDPKFNERHLKAFPVKSNTSTEIQDKVNELLYNTVYSNGIYSKDPRLNQYVETEENDYSSFDDEEIEIDLSDLLPYVTPEGVREDGTGQENKPKTTSGEDSTSGASGEEKDPSNSKEDVSNEKSDTSEEQSSVRTRKRD